MFAFDTWEASIRSQLFTGIDGTALDPREAAGEVAWPNRDFKTPAGKTHVRVFIDFEDVEQMDVGETEASNVSGRVTLVLKSPKGTGGQQHLSLASALHAILHGRRFDGITCLESVVESRGRVDTWWVSDITTLFEVAS